MHGACVVDEPGAEKMIANPGTPDSGSTSSFEFPMDDGATAKSAATPMVHHLCFGPSKWDDAGKWLANPPPSGRAKVIPLHGYSVTSIPKRFPTRQTKDNASMSSPDESSVDSSNGDVSLPLLQEQGVLDCSKGDGAMLDGDNCIGSGLPVDSRHGFEANGFAFPAPPCHERATNIFDLHASHDKSSSTKELSVSHESINGDKLTEPSAWDRASYAIPEPSLRSVSMRDMGTEMTPIASQEPSRTGTPVQSTTPQMRSPVSSGPSTPHRATATSSPPQRLGNVIQVHGDKVLAPDRVTVPSEPVVIEEQQQTRRASETLGVQLGKINVIAWGNNPEDGDSSKLLKRIDLEEVKRNVLEARATAWEEAEQSKFVARFEREEAKIQAWENLEKAKAEAEMRRIEVKIEKIRSHAHEKLMNKLAATKRRAEERRAIAEARRSEQAAKVVATANHIRQTGRMPSPIFGCAFCP